MVLMILKEVKEIDVIVCKKVERKSVFALKPV
jgi:hypothetical protein